MLIKKINTSYNSFELYTLFKDKPYSFFLDSGMDHKRLGKYSFIGFDPFVIFKSKNKKITITKDHETKTYIGNPFEKLRELLSFYKMDYETDLPFIGGAVGYFSYDLCHHIEKLPRTAIDDVHIPDCFLCFYDGIIIINHEKSEVSIAALGIKATEKEIISDIEKIIKNKPLPKIGYLPKKEKVSIQSNFKKEDYLKAINKVKDYILSGDIYQANMTQRFSCHIHEEPIMLYNRLRAINPAPFASFLNYGDFHIVSSSPERFIKINGNKIETRPIKGTRPRGKKLEEDIKNKEELLSSEKDQAELLMIVDLERNDLGKISKTGTVKVTELFHLETYPTVYHLVSTVIGEIKDEYDVIDCIEATFPGGSITGAPKIRAMEIIDELEPTQRNIYTGSIGYIGFNGNTDLNIVIRTIVCKNDKAYFQAGGGIVWDSDADLEYEETLHKAKALIKALKD
ncbi:MAG: aminodeoxychorismate synthase component I [Marinisporobacter sp.]|jgi:para-aminobenzoate synthetase component 1|nr:aminodeoxychorismate synthase component I [Marinisporobacter sp.]